MRKLHGVVILAALLATLLGLSSHPVCAQTVLFNPEVHAPVHQSVSPPLREIPPTAIQHLPKREFPLLRPHPARPVTSFTDPVAQTIAGGTLATTSSSNYDGLGQGFAGPQGTFSVDGAPPDTNMAVGPTQIVQWVNSSFAVFDKATGAVLHGPIAGNALWQAALKGTNTTDFCELLNAGDIMSDPIVRYDLAADRWIFTIIALNTSSNKYSQCFGVSKTGDATGGWYLYDFSMSPDLPDYPKLSVWPDAYYLSYNNFPYALEFFYQGPVACGVNRSAMLSGASALMLCWQIDSTHASLLPGDLDGSTPPATGSPGIFVELGSSSLNLWRAHLDFKTTSNSTLTGPISIPVAAYSQACGGGTCVPQLNSGGQQLDSLGDRLMYRLAYRNFGTYESLVTNHSVTSGSTVGVRWYEVRSPFGTPTMYQQGTYAPDTTNYRWMGSIAMDKAGDIAMGYSISSSTIYPSINYTGRVPGDTLGTMQAETTIVNGTGSQQSGLSRWGDYSSIVIDPSDDCTFWYTTEYLKTSGTFNWNTRIASFALANCATPGTPDFTISATPSSQTVTQGGSTGYTVNVGPVNGFTGSVSLSVSGLPTNTTFSFNPSSVTGSGSSTLSIGTASTTPAGSYTLTITGTSGSLTHTTAVTLVVTSPPPPPPPDFSISSSSQSPSPIVRGGTANYTVTASGSNGFAGSVSLKVTGTPSGSTATFNPASVSLSSGTTSGTSNLSVTTRANGPWGTFTLSITGTSGAVTHSTTVTLQVKKK